MSTCRGRTPPRRSTERDRRWQESVGEILGDNAWYQSQPQAVRRASRSGSSPIRWKRGVEFENVLSRGLLWLRAGAANGSAAYRYAYHEVIEEVQALADVSGVRQPQRLRRERPVRRAQVACRRRCRAWAACSPSCSSCTCSRARCRSTRRSARSCGAATAAPAVAPDRADPRDRGGAPRLLRAKYLASHVGRLSRWQRLQIAALRAVRRVAQTARLMLRPPLSFTRQPGIPDRVMREGSTAAPSYREYLQNAVRPLYETFERARPDRCSRRIFGVWVGVVLRKPAEALYHRGERPADEMNKPQPQRTKATRTVASGAAIGLYRARDRVRAELLAAARWSRLLRGVDRGAGVGIGLASHGFFAMVVPILRGTRKRGAQLQSNSTAAARAARGVSHDAQRVRSLEELSAAIAHEIRNPITAAKSLVQLLAEDPRPSPSMRASRSKSSTACPASRIAHSAALRA